MRDFIGIVDYYRDMWARRSHLLNPLIALKSNNVEFKWTDVEQKAFDGIKRYITQDILLPYPSFNKCFNIHADASDYQIGLVITQNGKHIAFYSLKRTGSQIKYTVIEK